MYCVFCGKPDVAACLHCGRWVCARHSTPWKSGVACTGCRRRLARIRLLRIAVAIVAVVLIGLTTLWVLNIN